MSNRSDTKDSLSTLQNRSSHHTLGKTSMQPLASGTSGPSTSPSTTTAQPNNASKVSTTSTLATSTNNSSNQSGANGSSSATAINLAANRRYIEHYDFQYCDESNKYEKVAKIGQGTFGEVFKARERRSNRKFVAMKKVLMENEKEGVRNWVPSLPSTSTSLVMQCLLLYYIS